MSSYVFELSDVSIANGDNTLYINNADSVFGAIPGSWLWIDSYRPRFVQSVDNTARTVTLTADWDSTSVVNKTAVIAPVASFNAHQQAVDALNNTRSAVDNLIEKYSYNEGSSVKGFNTKTELAALSPTETGQNFYCVNPVREDYKLREETYVAKPGDITCQNGRILERLTLIQPVAYLSVAFSDDRNALIGWASNGGAKLYCVYAVGGADTEGVGAASWQCIDKAVSLPANSEPETFGALTVGWFEGALYIPVGSNYDRFMPYRKANCAAYGAGREFHLFEAVKRGIRLDGGTLTLTKGVTVTLTDEQEIVGAIDTLAGGYSLVIENTVGADVSASDIVRGAWTVDVASVASFSVGQYIQIKGAVGHEKYTPGRYTTGLYCARIRGINGLSLQLDRTVEYILTGVTVCPVDKTAVALTIEHIDSTTLAINNVPRVRLASHNASGSVGDTDGVRFVSVENAAYGDITFEADSAEGVFGALFNNISSGQITYHGAWVGATAGESKSFRANGLCNLHGTITNIGSRKKSVGIQGARNCQFRIIDTGGGMEHFDSGSTAGNRLETINLLECDKCPCHVVIKHANDQAFEYVACTDSELTGQIEQSPLSTGTEGCVVFKGASSGLRLSAKVKAYYSYGLKIECIDGIKDVHVLPTAEVHSEYNAPIILRGAAAPYDTHVVIEGMHSKGDEGPIITLREFSNKVRVDIIADMTYATTGVQVAADDCLVSVQGINTQTNKELVNISQGTGFIPGKVFGDTLDVFIEYNNETIDQFEMRHCALVQGEIKFSGLQQYFRVRGGVFYSNNIPTNGNFQNGDRYYRESYNLIGTNDYLFNQGPFKLVELGRHYHNGEWSQSWCLQKVGV